jgi:hypothetical protein
MEILKSLSEKVPFLNTQIGGFFRMPGWVGMPATDAWFAWCSLPKT